MLFKISSKLPFDKDRRGAVRLIPFAVLIAIALGAVGSLTYLRQQQASSIISGQRVRTVRTAHRTITYDWRSISYYAAVTAGYEVGWMGGSFADLEPRVEDILREREERGWKIPSVRTENLRVEDVDLELNDGSGSYGVDSILTGGIEHIVGDASCSGPIQAQETVGARWGLLRKCVLEEHSKNEMAAALALDPAQTLEEREEELNDLYADLDIEWEVNWIEGVETIARDNRAGRIVPIEGHLEYMPYRLVTSKENLPDLHAPVARLTVTPSRGTVSTVFEADASDSTDVEDPTSALEARFDWTDDGSWDTPLSGDLIAEHSYSTLGQHTIKVQVCDTDGLTDTASNSIMVFSSRLPPPPSPPAPTPVTSDTYPTSLRVTVRDFNYGHVVKGAKVTVSGVGTDYTSSPAHFDLGLWSSGEKHQYTVSASKSGYEQIGSSSKQVTVSAGESKSVTLHLKKIRKPGAKGQATVITKEIIPHDAWTLSGAYAGGQVVEKSPEGLAIIGSWYAGSGWWKGRTPEEVWETEPTEIVLEPRLGGKQQPAIDISPISLSSGSQEEPVSSPSLLDTVASAVSTAVNVVANFIGGFF